MTSWLRNLAAVVNGHTERVVALETKLEKLMSVVDDLVAQVATTVAVEQAALAKINDLAKQLQDAVTANNPMAIAKAAADLKAATDPLAAVAPVPAPAPAA